MIKNKTCNNCHKTFLRPAHLIAHQNRKIPCVANPIVCEYCNITFSRNDNLVRHLNESCLKEDSKFYKLKVKKDRAELDKKKQDIEKDRDEIYKMIKAFDQKHTTNNITNTSNNNNNNNINNNGDTVLNMVVITKDYICQNFLGAPHMAALQNYDDVRNGILLKDKEQKPPENTELNFIDEDSNEDDNEQSEEIENENEIFVNAIVLKYKYGKLSQYFGDIIISSYKKENDAPNQSFWCSDVPRLKFLVKSLLMSSESKWMFDSSAIAVKKEIIKPLLNYVVKCINEYLENSSSDDIINDPDKYVIINNIIMVLKGDYLVCQITRHIAPHFAVGKYLEIKN